MIFQALLFTTFLMSSADDRAVKVKIDPKRTVYDVNVSYGYTTTVWFPIDCHEPSRGKSSIIDVIYDQKSLVNRRFVLRPRSKKIGAVTNVTFDCTGDVRIILQITVGSIEDAVVSIEFQFAEDEEPRIRAALERQEIKLNEQFKARAEAIRIKALQDAEERFTRSLLRRFSFNKDIEFGRKNYVVGKVFRQIVIGSRAYLLFRLENLSTNDFTVKSIEVFTNHSEEPIENPLVLLPESRLTPEQSTLGAIAFDIPEENDEFKVIIKEDGSRTIEIKDIEL